MLGRRNSPIYNPKPLLPNINSNTKLGEKRPINAQDRAWKQHKSKAITRSSFDEIYPSTIPNHSSQLSAKIQSLKKLAQERARKQNFNIN